MKKSNFLKLLRSLLLDSELKGLASIENLQDSRIEILQAKAAERNV